jgi:radical SAM protein with 4Fe4S-binding SPASM domain
MTKNYNIVGTILFSQSLGTIRNQLECLQKEKFDPLDRIVIQQDSEDDYSYADGVGSKLIEIQKIINQVDISNCFILLVTTNKNVADEIDFVTKFYSVDPIPMEFFIEDGHYEKIIKRHSNTACKKLWNHLYVGTDGNVNPCCLADHRFPLGNIDDDNVDTILLEKSATIRSEMQQGYRNRACASCYEKEDNGIVSARQFCDPHDQVLSIQNIDIRLNNICNFKCRMCSEYYSSAIQQETIEVYGENPLLGFEKTINFTDIRREKKQRLEKILPFVDSSLQNIYFAGGEPLIMHEHYLILDRLIDLHKHDLSIRYNTNLSKLVYKQFSVIDKWKKFSDVTVGASIDASDNVGEYLRYGTVWSEILDNIKIIKTQAPHVKLRITSTVSCLNIENLIALQNKWIDEKFFTVDDFSVNVLTSPNFLSPAMLPHHHKNRMSQLIQNHISKLQDTELAKQWKNVLQWMNKNDYRFVLEDFKQRTAMLDKIRDQSFVSVFPEFQDLYD